MIDAYLGEIKQFGYNFPPKGWAFCHGQILQIKYYSALFSLLGTEFGGDGINTFALPDFRPRNNEGNLVYLNVGDVYEGKPYLETCIAIEGVFPSRG